MVKKLITFIVIVAAVTALVLYLNKPKINKGPAVTTNNGQQKTVQTEPTVKAVEITQLPEMFPADFPIEAGAEVVSNYNAQANGVNQATRQFNSKKTLAQNIKIYMDYFQNSDWTLLGASKQKEVFAVVAENKDKKKLQITINSIKSGSVIDATFVY